MVYDSTDSLRCFECGDVWHKRFECPLKEQTERGRTGLYLGRARGGCHSGHRGKPLLHPGTGVCSAPETGDVAEVNEGLVASLF